MQNHSISIILPALNSESTLGLAIVSIIRQTFTDWELLLIDDGSSDRSIEIARSYGEPRIRVVADGVHRGLAPQLNRGVAMARGKYVARMDADDIACPERLRKQFEFLESHPNIDLVGGWMAVFQSDGKLRGMRRPPTDHDGICARPWLGIAMAHPTWMGRAEWFRRNPYPTNAVRMEDWELLLRAYPHSRFANLPEVMMGYREDSLSLKKQFLARKNACKFIARYGREHRKFLLAGVSIGSQIARALLDMVALSTGLGHSLLRYRAVPATSREAEQWNQLWNAITSGRQAA